MFSFKNANLHKIVNNTLIRHVLFQTTPQHMEANLICLGGNSVRMLSPVEDTSGNVVPKVKVLYEQQRCHV